VFFWGKLMFIVEKSIYVIGNWEPKCGGVFSLVYCNYLGFLNLAWLGFSLAWLQRELGKLRASDLSLMPDIN
jgi:hypothetical protein